MGDVCGPEATYITNEVNRFKFSHLTEIYKQFMQQKNIYYENPNLLLSEKEGFFLLRVIWCFSDMLDLNPLTKIYLIN